MHHHNSWLYFKRQEKNERVLCTQKDDIGRSAGRAFILNRSSESEAEALERDEIPDVPLFYTLCWCDVYLALQLRIVNHSRCLSLFSLVGI